MRMTNSSATVSMKAFRANTTAFISRTFMCSPFSYLNHTLNAVKLRKLHPSWSEKHWCTGEREEANGEEPRMTTPPLRATRDCTFCIPESWAPATMDRLQLETNRNLAAMWTNSCCHQKRRNLSTRSWNLII